MDDRRKKNLIQRAKIIQGIRAFFTQQGFLEIETPCVVPSPGMEPHLSALEVFCTGPDGARRKRYLHTSPEYAMKKLLAQGWGIRKYPPVGVYHAGMVPCPGGLWADHGRL